MTEDWKTKNQELIDYQMNLEVKKLEGHLKSVREMADVAREIIQKSEVPIYFDIQYDSLTLFTRVNKETIDKLAKNLDITFAECPDKKFLGVYRKYLVRLDVFK